MLLASYALVCGAESRPVACRSVFHPFCHLVFHPVFRQIGCRASRLGFRQIYPPVFHPFCHSAEQRTCLSAATVSPAGRMGWGVGVLPGYRRRGQTRAEAGGWQDNWCAGHRSVRRVAHPAVVVRILGPLVLVPFPVSILDQNARVPIAQVQISRAPLLV
jgi:hypothetical protein